MTLNLITMNSLDKKPVLSNGSFLAILKKWLLYTMKLASEKGKEQKNEIYFMTINEGNLLEILKCIFKFPHCQVSSPSPIIPLQKPHKILQSISQKSKFIKSQRRNPQGKKRVRNGFHYLGLKKKGKKILP